MWLLLCKVMKSDISLRRVQITGGSTYIVSLPKSWAQSLNLKAGDYVRLIPQPDNSLLLVPGSERGSSEEAVIAASPESSPEEVARELIACYLAGYDSIRIRLDGRVDEFKSYLKNVMRTKLIGLELVEESTNYMVVRSLIGYVDLPIADAIKRMNLITVSMCRDAIRALKTRDRSLMNDVIQRDDEVDRLYLFCVRQLKSAVENGILMKEVGLRSARECLGYRLIVKSIERVADHAVRIASQVPALKARSRLVDRIAKLSETVFSIYEASVQSLFDSDMRQANRVITRVHELERAEKELVKSIFESRTGIESAIALRLVIESLRRIAEYAADIAEIVINLAIKR